MKAADTGGRREERKDISLNGSTARSEEGPVVLTGATGFIGSRALGALTDGGRGAGVRALVRTVSGDVQTDRSGGVLKAGSDDMVRVRPGDDVKAGSVEWVRGDLTDPDAVRGLCEGARAVVHLASYIGGDERLCQAVNVDATRALMAEARRAGVRRVVHLSTPRCTARPPPGHHRGRDTRRAGLRREPDPAGR
ncbi:NAD-dependent epimerase/dehydratase family protein [Streptomyces phaeoluteigriseus]|uniref:NAD-dependent epimerase/dehydratase family protein n=1 Tax=Streptomyces phaeoluteigriseus TaxID=114686 RepID=UPI001FEB0E53|nr:NAD-dependent epimerase/dehydratase family protein [Streptomyces phaeoluteigriseus]